MLGIQRLVHLHVEEQDVGALADAIDHLHVVHLAAAERQAQGVEEGVLGLRLEHEIDYVAAFLVGDGEAFADLRDVAGEQQRRRLGQALIELLDGHLLQVRVVQPDLLAVGNEQLLVRRIGMPAEQSRPLQAQLAGGFLQARAATVQGQLGKTRGQGLGLVQQAGQALDSGAVVGMGQRSAHGQGGNEQRADQSHRNPLKPVGFNHEPAPAR